MLVKKTIGRPLARIGLVTAVAATTTLVGLATPALAADTLTSVIPSRGPSGGGNTIVLTTPGANYTGTPNVQFSWTTCGASVAAASPAASATTPFALTAGVVDAAPTILSNPKQLSVTVPASIALLTGQTTATWNVCVYPAVGAGQVLASSGTYTIGTPGLDLSSNYGPSGGGNIITATPNSGTLPNTVAVQFQYVGNTAANAWCTANPATAAAPAASAGPPVTQTAGVVAVAAAQAPVASGKITITVPAALALTTTPAQLTAQYNICVYASTGSTAALLAGTGKPYTIAGKTLTLNTTKGPLAGGVSTLIATLPNGANFPAGATAELQWGGTGVNGGCNPVYQSAATPAGTAQAQNAGVVVSSDVRNLGDRLSITVPNVPAATTVSPTQTAASYNVCVYGGSTGTSPIVAGTTTVLALASPATVTGVTPDASGTVGGGEVTVYGTNFSSDMTAQIAGQDATVTSVADSGTSFTVTVPPHAAGGPFSISVSTAGGTASGSGLFTYSNGITLRPNTASNTKFGGTNVSVKGSGFAALPFVPGGADTAGTTPNTATPHIYLVKGLYSDTGTAPFKANGQVTECQGVLPLGDAELLCTLYLAGDGPNPQPAGAACDCTVAASVTNQMTTSTTQLTPQMVGMEVTSTGDHIGIGNYIASVQDATHATLAKNSDGTAVSAGVLTPTPVLSGATTSTAAGVTTLAKATSFAATDVGRLVVGPGIAPNTTIAGYTNAGAVTLSKPATANIGGGGATFTVGGYQVPTGVYTMTVVSSGAPNASAVAGYWQTVISSGSTFTVAGF